MSGTKADYIRYRLERADETLDEARLMASNQHWIGCVNRCYYACFYAVSALLFQADLSSSKHSGVRSLFNQGYVKTGLVTKDMGKLYNALFQHRQKGDYDDMIVFELDQVQQWLVEAEIFVQQIGTGKKSDDKQKG